MSNKNSLLREFLLNNMHVKNVPCIGSRTFSNNTMVIIIRVRPKDYRVKIYFYNIINTLLPSNELIDTLPKRYLT